MKAKKIHLEMRKGRLPGLKYHSVHFALRELLREGVLLQVGKAYYLGPDWVSSNYDRFDTLLSSYAAHSMISPASKFQEVEFDSVMQAFQFVLEKLKQEQGQATEVFAHVARLFPLPLTSSDFLFLRQLAKKVRIVVLCRFGGLPEKISANFLRQLGIEVYLGVPCAMIANTVIFNGKVITFHVQYSRTELENFNKFYFSQQKASRNILKSDIFLRFFDFVMLNFKVTAAIVKSPEIYNDYLMQTRKLIPVKI